jgi:7-carboxy-7-deazaguanine synthase
MLAIAEKYITLSGEAPAPGIPVFLVRFHGCNLDCSYCDTVIACSPAGVVSADALVEEITTRIESYPTLAVLFTGGEPLLGERQGELVGIMRRLHDVTFFVETNGTIDIVETDIDNCSYVVDVKTPSSGQADAFIPDLPTRLRPDRDCIKIVLAESDLEWVVSKIAEIHAVNRLIPVYLSPQWGRIDLKRLADFILDKRLDARISIQQHKYIWGADAKGV